MLNRMFTWGKRGAQPHRPHFHDHIHEKSEVKHVPLIVSPLEDPPNVKPADDDHPVFKHLHEASGIELFYDLFFVANLAVFTQNHDVNSASTFSSHVGFFSLLWATWFQTSLYDIRFAYDSIFLRICKAIHFGVQIGFVVAGAVYSTDPALIDKAAFQTLAIVQMISRLTLAVQYGSILWFVKSYRSTILPLVTIMGILFAAAIVYLATFFAVNRPSASLTIYYVWYVVAPLEIISTLVTSSFWRVLSFKGSHLVERLGLITLIVMGEGIIGLSKSVSYLLQTSSSVTARDVGVLIVSTLLIYLVWMLYHDQVQSNRFGTIKEQIWALMHYPLHLCILFTVEGSTNLFVWVIVAPLYYEWQALCPEVYFGDEAVFEQFWPDRTSLSTYIEMTISDLSLGFKDAGKLSYYYDYQQNITSIENIMSSFGSIDYQIEANALLLELWQGVGNAIFKMFGVLPPAKPKNGQLFQPGGYGTKSLSRVFDVVFVYFYVSAGLYLIVLSVLYMLGNKGKTKSEWFGIAFRILVGIGIALISVGIRFPSSPDKMSSFIIGPAHVIIVMAAYLVVLLVDNFLNERTISREKKKRESESDAENFCRDSDAISIWHTDGKQV